PDPLGLRGHDAEAMMLADFMAYLPEDLLCKVDRTSMAVGLEARAPLLDWRVAGFAWSLPQHMKLREGTSKYLLKQVLRGYLPDVMIDRGKRGFGAPVSQWLRGDLSQWAGDLLAPAALRRDGLLDQARVGAVWQGFRRGQRKWHTHLWNVLMFQAWHAYWRASRGGCGSARSQVGQARAQALQRRGVHRPGIGQRGGHQAPERCQRRAGAQGRPAQQVRPGPVAGVEPDHRAGGLEQRPAAPAMATLVARQQGRITRVAALAHADGQRLGQALHAGQAE